MFLQKEGQIGKKTNSKSTYRGRDRITLEPFFEDMENYLWIYEDPNAPIQAAEELLNRAERTEDENLLLRKENVEIKKQWKKDRDEKLPPDVVELVKKLTPEQIKNLTDIAKSLNL